MTVVLGCVIVVVFLAIHAVFVAGEFSLVAAPRERMEQLAESGDRPAQRVLKALKALSFQLSGAQLGITITSLLVGFVVEATLVDPLARRVEALGTSDAAGHVVAAVVALGAATTAEMVFAELVPKNYAIARPLPAARRYSGPLWWFSRILRPVIAVFNSSANWFVRRLGVEPREELRSVRTLEELELLIRTSGEQGALDRDEVALLRRTIRFGHRTVAAAMIQRSEVVAVDERSSVTDLFQIALSSGHSRFPVYGERLDDIVGVVDVKDGLAIAMGQRDDTPLTAIVRPAFFTPATTALDTMLAEMRESGTQLSVVIDEHGGLDGILTLEDVLEELVGEIADEYDPLQVQPSAVTPVAGGWLVEGTVRVDDIADLTGFVIPPGHYDTIAGFVLARLGRIPDAGVVVRYRGWRLEVVSVDGLRIAQLRLQSPPTQAPA